MGPALLPCPGDCDDDDDDAVTAKREEDAFEMRGRRNRWWKRPNTTTAKPEDALALFILHENEERARGEDDPFCKWQLGRAAREGRRRERSRVQDALMRNLCLRSADCVRAKFLWGQMT